MTLKLNQPDVALNVINFDLNGNEIVYVENPIDITYVDCVHRSSITERVIETPIALRCLHVPAVDDLIAKASTRISLPAGHEAAIQARGSYDPNYEFKGTP